MIISTPLSERLGCTVDEAAQLWQSLLETSGRETYSAQDALQEVEVALSWLPSDHRTLSDVRRLLTQHRDAFAIRDDAGWWREWWRSDADREWLEAIRPAVFGTLSTLARQHVVTLDIEVRRGELQEVGICEADGTTHEWRSEFTDLRRWLDERPSVVLAGHNLQFDLAHLREFVGDHPAFARPFVDTLHFAVLLDPRSPQPLTLPGAEHTAVVDAQRTLELLRDQLGRWSRLPSDHRARCRAAAGPALAALLDALPPAATPKPRRADRPPPTPPSPELHDLARFFLTELEPLLAAAAAEDGSTLVIAPRALLPRLARRPGTVVWDPVGDPGYLQSLAGAPEHVRAETPTYLLSLLEHFRETSLAEGHDTHEAGMASWLRENLREVPSLRAWALVGFEQVPAEVRTRQAALTIVPYEAVVNAPGVNLVRSQPWTRVIVIDGLDAAGLCREVALPPLDLKQRLELDLAGRPAVGVNDQSPEGWRRWWERDAAGAWTLCERPVDLTEYVRSLLPPSVPCHPVLLGAGAHVQVLELETEAHEPLVLPTAQAEAWLAQVAAVVHEVASKQRVLVILARGRASAAERTDSLSQALRHLEVYVPATDAALRRRVELLGEHGAGAVVVSEQQLLSQVYPLIEGWTGAARPFDRVVLDAWPLDCPELVQPAPLREADEPARQPAEADLEDEPEDEEGAETGDGSAGDQDLDQSAAGSVAVRPGATRSPLARQRAQLGQAEPALRPILYATEQLSGAPLLVLDPRFAPNEAPTGLGSASSAQRTLPAPLRDKARTKLHEIAPRMVAEDHDIFGNEELWNPYAKTLLGIDQLHDWQVERLRAMREGRPALTIERPTGGGKSAVFQLAGLWRGMQNGGLTIVISPLRALIADQCDRLWGRGLLDAVGMLSGDMDQEEIRDTLSRVAGGETLLLYVAPERFRTKRFRRAIETRLERDGRLNFFVFDEAHCVTQWGHDFRPDFLHAAHQAVRLVRRPGPPAPIVLCTATFPERCIHELRTLLSGGLETELELDRAGDALGSDKLLRDSIQLEMLPDCGAEDRPAMLGQLLGAEGFDPNQSRAVVFVTSRRRAEQLAEDLQGSTQLPVEPFHAGLSADVRRERVDDFRSTEADAVRVLCATKAFGLGMDLPNIHLICHDGPAYGLEDYLQEVGRAARSEVALERAGLPFARAMLLHDLQDFRRMRDRVRGGALSDAHLAALGRVLGEARPRSGTSDEATVLVVECDRLSHRLGWQETFGNSAETAVRLGLHWLERFGLLQLGDFVPAHLTLRVLSEAVAEPPELRGAGPMAHDLWAMIHPLVTADQQTVRLELAALRRNLRASQDALHDALGELVRRTCVAYDRELQLPLGRHQVDEVHAGAGERSWPRLTAALDAARRLLVDVVQRGTLECTHKELADRYTAPCAAELSADSYTWLTNRDDRQKAVDRDIRVLQTKVTTAIRLLRDVGAITNRQIATRSGLRYKLMARPDARWWIEHLELVVKEALFQAWEVSGPGSPESVSPHDFLSGLRGAAGTPRADALVNIRAAEGVLGYLRVLGYVRTADRFFPTGIEAHVDDRVVRVQAAMNDQPEVLAAFHEQYQLRMLRVFALATFSMISNRFSQSNFIRRYFREATSVGELRQVVEESLEENSGVEAASTVLAWLRDDAYNEEHTRLDAKQKAVVNSPFDRHLLVSAGPGTGKTHTLLVRVARLILGQGVPDGSAPASLGVPPGQILILSFTRAVVSELQQRLHELFGKLGFLTLVRSLRIQTFHGFAIHQLHELRSRYPALKIAEPQMRSCIKDLRRLLIEFPDVKRRVRNRFRHIFVDEFQDVDDEKLGLLRLLAQSTDDQGVDGQAVGAWLTVVGDDDQAIFDYDRSQESRVPASERFDRFETEFRALSLRQLTNYRTHRTVVEANKEPLAVLSLGGLRPARTDQLAHRAEVGPTDHFRYETRDPSSGNVVAWVEVVQQRLLELGTHRRQREGLPHSDLVAVLGRSNEDVFRARQELRSAGREYELLVQGSESRFGQRRDVREVMDQLEQHHLERSAEDLKSLLPDLLGSTVARQWDTHERHDLLRLLQAFSRELPLSSATVEQFVEFIRLASHTGSYLHLIARTLLEDETESRHVLLSTIHKAKGLEFPGVVILPSQWDWAADGRRYSGAKGVARALDDELRVLYVAQTRAEDVLLAIRGSREEAMLSRQTGWEAGDQSEGTLAIYTQIGDLAPFSFGATKRRMEATAEAKPGDPVDLVYRSESYLPKERRRGWYLQDRHGRNLGRLTLERQRHWSNTRSSEDRYRLADRLARRFDGVGRLCGAEISAIYHYRQAEDGHGPDFLDDLCPRAVRDGYLIAEIAGVVRPSE